MLRQKPSLRAPKCKPNALSASFAEAETRIDPGRSPRPPLPSDVFVRQCGVTGNEFIRKAKALGKARGVAVVLNASRGQGKPSDLYFGAAFTVVRNPKDELKTGTLHAMCAQLGIRARDL